MECRNTSTERCRRTRAFTMVEMVVTVALTLVVATAMLIFSSFAYRSFVALANYTDLAQKGQIAVDKMSREVRQALQVTDFSTDSFAFLDAASNTVRFSYDAPSRTLFRISGGFTNSYLPECDSLRWSAYQHTPQSNSFDCYAPAYVTNTSLIQVSWVCSRNMLGRTMTTESMQSAKITIRNH